MWRVAIVTVLGVILVACGGPSSTATPDAARLTTARVLVGLSGQGTVRAQNPGSATTTTPEGIEETPTLIVYVGQPNASSVHAGYLIVAPPSLNIRTIAEATVAKLKAGEPGKSYLIALDRNAALILAPVQSTAPENDRAAVETAMRAIR